MCYLGCYLLESLHGRSAHPGDPYRTRPALLLSWRPGALAHRTAFPSMTPSPVGVGLRLYFLALENQYGFILLPSVRLASPPALAPAGTPPEDPGRPSRPAARGRDAGGADTPDRHLDRPDAPNPRRRRHRHDAVVVRRHGDGAGRRHCQYLAAAHARCHRQLRQRRVDQPGVDAVHPAVLRVGGTAGRPRLRRGRRILLGRG